MRLRPTTTTCLLLLAIGSVACGRIGFLPEFDDEVPPVAGTSPDDGADASVVDAQPPALQGAQCGQVSSGCSDPEVIFCDSFESGDFTPWDWTCEGDDYQCTEPIPEVTIEVDATTTCAGSNAATMWTAGGPGSRQNSYLGIFIEPTDEYFVRTYLYVPQASHSADHNFLIAFTGNGTDVSSGESFRLGFGATEGELELVMPSSADSFLAGVGRDRWICVEARMGPSGIDVWVDDVLEHEFQGSTLEPGLLWNGLALGIIDSDQVGATLLTMDEVVVSKNRIGCGMVP